MTVKILAIVLALGAVPAFAQPIDLGQPGVMATMRRDDPERYAKVQEIIKVAEETTCDASFNQILHARFAATGHCAALQLYTSFPAKREITFGVDGQAYRTMVRVRDSLAQPMPAR